MGKYSLKLKRSVFKKKFKSGSNIVAYIMLDAVMNFDHRALPLPGTYPKNTDRFFYVCP